MKTKSQSKVIEDKPSRDPKSFRLHCFEGVFASISMVVSFFLVAYAVCFLKFLSGQLSKLLTLCFSCFF